MLIKTTPEKAYRDKCIKDAARMIIDLFTAKSFNLQIIMAACIMVVAQLAEGEGLRFSYSLRKKDGSGLGNKET